MATLASIGKLPALAGWYMVYPVGIIVHAIVYFLPFELDSTYH